MALQNLLTFYKLAKDDEKALVHCLKGHGRTGTFALILTRLLQYTNNTFDGITQARTLDLLREQRANLCEKSQQYYFAEEVVYSEWALDILQ